MKICHYVSRQNVFHYFLYLIHIFIIIILLFYSSTVQVIKIPLAKATTILAVSRYQNIVFTTVYLKNGIFIPSYLLIFEVMNSNIFYKMHCQLPMLIDIAYVVLKKHEIWMNKKSKMASEFITIIAVSCTQVKCAKSQNEPPLLLSLIRKPLYSVCNIYCHHQCKKSSSHDIWKHDQLI